MSEQQARRAAVICGVIIAGFASAGLFLEQLYLAHIPELSDCARYGILRASRLLR
jgi:hypothetical protein